MWDWWAQEEEDEEEIERDAGGGVEKMKRMDKRGREQHLEDVQGKREKRMVVVWREAVKDLDDSEHSVDDQREE